MRRVYRLALTAAVLATCLGAMSGLTWFSSKSEGPLVTSLDWVGTTFGSIEHRVLQNLEGGLGRNSQLAWFAQYRLNPDRLRQPETILLGAYDSGLPGTLDGMVEFEHAIGTTLPLVHVYCAWGDASNERFPERLATAIWDMGSVPVITWEPWLTAFENTDHPLLPLRDARDRQGWPQ